MAQPRWSLQQGDGPILAVANHSGHELRPELSEICILPEADRFREEDPYTDYWAQVVPNRLIPYPSRFEVDLNRARFEAFYLEPKDAWGLHIWREKPNPAISKNSLQFYDEYYNEIGKILRDMEQRYGAFLVLDLHSYNHRRPGPNEPPEDPLKNPEVNVGTGTMNREFWAPLVDRFIADLRKFNYLDRHLDVRENIKFVGRQLPHWVHENFPKTGCALALEFKKFFMDEWTGKLFPEHQQAILAALQSTIPGLLEVLNQRGHG